MMIPCRPGIGGTAIALMCSALHLAVEKEEEGQDAEET
jgi:hypothetical protein